MRIQPKPERARQLLPKECYFSSEWFEREHAELFNRSWTFGCTTGDLPHAGDYRAVRINRYPVIILRDRNGEIRAYHNTCRHRGTQIFEEGAGNCRHGIVCPYHSWSYALETGNLRSLPKKDICFPDLDTDAWGLHRCSVGTIGELVFVNPQEEPEESFESWIDTMEQTHMWPHRIADLSEKRPVRYDIMGNWKAFCENAMDGYHLSYLHHKTLMGPDVEDQDWDPVGRHWVSIAYGESESRQDGFYDLIPGVDHSKRHPVVWQFFPNSGVLATTIFFSAYVIVPVSPERCWLDLRTWMMPKERSRDARQRSRPSGTSGHGHIMDDGRRYISIAELNCHPMETYDFQIEDMWVVEQQQKALHSPMMQTGQLASLGETSLTWFQSHILDYVPLRES